YFSDRAASEFYTLSLHDALPILSRYRRRRLQWLVPWMFVAPALILFLYFKILPLAQGVQMSFYDVRPYLGDRYVGGGNYVEATRSEEHTSELQSLRHLVCRLLLE